MPRQSKPKLTRRQKQSTWIILIAIIIMSSATYWIVNRNYVSPAEEYKAASFTEKNIELFAYYKESQEAFIPGIAQPSNELIFKASSTYPAYVALYEVNQQGRSSIIFSGTRIPPGQYRKIEREEALFVYTLPKNTANHKVCLLAQDSAQKLELLLSKVVQNTLPENQSNCIEFN